MSETVFIVLFRGVGGLFRGAGGRAQLPTRPLREALIEAGFPYAVTYIASGNLVLASEVSLAETRARVAAIAAERFDFTKAIMVVTARAWSRLVTGNPFPEAVNEPTTLHAFVLGGRARAGALDVLSARASPTERLSLEGQVLYLHTPAGFAASKLPPIIDRTLGVETTARNWNTVLKLEALAKEAASRASRG
jgi:uncharacterized protein (DUF1697 family)